VPRVSACAARVVRWVLASVFLGASAGPSFAAPLDCISTGSLDLLIAQGAEPCGSGRGATFDYAYEIIGSGGAVEPPAGAVWVQSVSTRYSQGIEFIGDWRVSPGQALDVHLAYSFGPMRLRGRGGVTVLAEPWWGASPVLLAATLCLGTASPCDPASLYLPTGGSAWFQDFHFPESVTAGRIELWFRMEGPQEDAHVDAFSITTVSSGFSVPEPGAAVLVALAVAFHGLSRRRIRT
jgi:hypothetical protein